MIESLLFSGDIKALQRIAATSPGGVIVNVGAFKGASCAVMAQANPRVTVLAVDTFEGVEQSETKGVELRDEFAANMRAFPNVCGLRCDSVTAARMVCTEIEAAFIDGDHSYEAALADMEAWWPKVRVGGILCGHDCVDSCGVPRALDEFCRARGLQATVMLGDCHGFWVVKKEQQA